MPENSDLPIKYEHVTRFQPGSPESIDYLNEHGYVVIANALSTDEASNAVSKLWDYLEGLETGIDRNDVNTWDNDRWPTAVHGGILPGHGIGQCEAQWYVRDVPNVKKSFAAVWDTDELLVSFDGVSLWRPWTHNPNWKTGLGGSWLHIDQHPIGRPGKQCVQGLVNLLPMTADTGGNVVIPGSHLMHKKIPELYTDRLARIPAQVDHFRFPNNDPQLADSNPITCHMEAGDLLLWDSRTIHCSSPPTDMATADPDPNTLIRAISLICMMPREKSNDDVISRRKAAIAKRTSTTNWSDVWVNADNFPEVSAPEAKAKYTLPPVPKLSASQMKMVGWTDQEIAEM